ncbi:MGH1-like glycoside hydrolase domain-containing protein [Kiloniella sp. b19]|uniref:MGH1-like glycoside hydrolase domain-containing protein n=1 Tax=Kiloniella sp. GXU_MW_B19 TaxID=3141326 RepID=UPI0031D0F9D8
MKDLNVQSMNEQARAILRGNDRGGYTIPTAGLYPYQWNWDSAFAAFGFAQFDVERAWLELETLFSGQWDNGMVPHILYHQQDDGYFPGPEAWGTNGRVPSSGITQPPVAATFARKTFEQDPELGAVKMQGLYARLLEWHRWFMEWRAESGAVCVIHPWESGRDNATDWDKALANVDPGGIEPYERKDTSHVDASMRPTKYDYDRYMAIVKFGRDNGWDEAVIRDAGPFRVADPTLSFILLRAHRDLRWLADQLGKDTAELDQWIARLEKGVELLWNAEIGSYDSRDLRTGEFSGSITSASFLCWYGGVDDARMLVPLNRVLEESTYAIPSLDPANAQFNARRYWRGPIWAVVNTLIGLGLEETGHGEQAAKIRKDCRDLIGRNGFAEYFNPEDGSAAGGDAFSWTAAVWLAWIAREG